MRAFKKLMAGAIATAIAATMATSAFAAGFDAETGKVSVDFTAAEGQTTVLIVPAANWVEDVNAGKWSITSLDDEDILYIDQYESKADADKAVVAGFGVKLDSTGTLAVGNYYALFGGTTEDGFAITPVAFTVSSTPAEPEEPATREIQLGECDGLTAAVNVGDALAVLKHAAGITLLTGDALIAAECDGLTAAINVGDALAILKHAAGIELLGKITISD